MPLELVVSRDHENDQELIKRASEAYLRVLAKDIGAFLAEKNIEGVRIEGELRRVRGELLLSVIVYQPECDNFTKTHIFAAVNAALTYAQFTMGDQIITRSVHWRDVDVKTEFKDPERPTAQPYPQPSSGLRLVAVPP